MKNQLPCGGLRCAKPVGMRSGRGLGREEENEGGAGTRGQQCFQRELLPQSTLTALTLGVFNPTHQKQAGPSTPDVQASSRQPCADPESGASQTLRLLEVTGPSCFFRDLVSCESALHCGGCLVVPWTV